jgi:Tfp pilus assembly protein PilN
MNNKDSFDLDTPKIIYQLSPEIVTTGQCDACSPIVTTTGHEFRLRQQIGELQRQWDLLSQQLSEMRGNWIFETRPDEKMRLKHLIDEFETERQQIEQRLTSLEAQIFQ